MSEKPRKDVPTYIKVNIIALSLLGAILCALMHFNIESKVILIAVAILTITKWIFVVFWILEEFTGVH